MAEQLLSSRWAVPECQPQPLHVFPRPYTDRSRKGGTTVKDLLVEMLSWLFVMSEEEIMVEAEVAALTSMFIAEDPRPERPR